MLYAGAEFEIGNHWVLVDIIGVEVIDSKRGVANVDYRVVDIEELETTQFFDLDYDQLHDEVNEFAMEIKDK
jgi:hypothetical protein